MNVEEAALHLERLYGIVSEEYKRALDVVDDAFFKQVAKKVVVDTPTHFKKCPTCGNMYLHYYHHYCHKCGQKLKWTEEEEEK